MNSAYDLEQNEHSCLYAILKLKAFDVSEFNNPIYETVYSQLQVIRNALDILKLQVEHKNKKRYPSVH